MTKILDYMHKASVLGLGLIGIMVLYHATNFALMTHMSYQGQTAFTASLAALALPWMVALAGIGFCLLTTGWSAKLMESQNPS